MFINDLYEKQKMKRPPKIATAEKRSTAGLITLVAEGFLVTRGREIPVGFYVGLNPDWPTFPTLVFVTGQDLLEIFGSQSTVLVALAHKRRPRFSAAG
jgi:hypothetical protein